MGAPHAQGRRAQRGITCTRSDGQKRAGRRRSGGDGRDSRGANRRQHGHAFAFISSAPAPARRRDGSPNRSRRASEATKSQSSSLALPCACSHSQFTLTALPLPFARISSHAAAERERDGASERREGGRRPSISARVMNSERDRQTEVAAVAKMGMSMDADDGATSDLENRNEKQRRDRRDQHGFFLSTAGFCKGVH